MISLIWPAQGSVTSPFGPRTYMGITSQHEGIDIGAADKSSVVASAAGKITTEGFTGAGGNTIIINHGGGLTTMYNHLSKFIQPLGSVVAQGQQIGLSGGAAGEVGAGNARGAHLHFQVEQNDKPVDPMPLLTGGVVGSVMNNATAAEIKAAKTPAQKESLYNKILGPGRFVLDTINGTIDKDVAAALGFVGFLPKAVKTTYDAAALTNKVGNFIVDPTNWKRIGLGTLGAVFLLVATLELTSNSGAVSTIAKVVK